MVDREASFLLGALLGVLPGLVMVVRNMWYGWTLQKRVETVAWKERAWNDTLSHSQKLMFTKNPEPYFGPNDSPEMVKAKREQLAAASGIIRRHLIYGGIMFAGGIAGAISGYFVGGHFAAGVA